MDRISTVLVSNRGMALKVEVIHYLVEEQGDWTWFQVVRSASKVKDGQTLTNTLPSL